MELRWRIEHYIRVVGIPPTRFGRDCVNDPRLVPDMRRGRELRPETARRIADYLDRAERAAR
jgi:hypothetical protein